MIMARWPIPTPADSTADNLTVSCCGLRRLTCGMATVRAKGYKLGVPALRSALEAFSRSNEDFAHVNWCGWSAGSRRTLGDDQVWEVLARRPRGRSAQRPTSLVTPVVTRTRVDSAG